MRNMLVFVVLSGAAASLSGCAGMLQQVGLGGPPAPTTPATPVFFQEWSSALDQPAITTIAATAQAANEVPDAGIIVTGAADSVGSSKANEYLSETRAQVVADQLVSDGVAPSRLVVRGVGEMPAPGAGDDMPAQFSRRVLIQIEPASGLPAQTGKFGLVSKYQRGLPQS